MTTTAPDRELVRQLHALEERTRRAWSAYRESLRGLEGRDYEEAEARCWERLRRRLADVEQRRAELLPPDRQAARPEP
jgi:hypothetical protein